MLSSHLSNNWQLLLDTFKYNNNVQMLEAAKQSTDHVQVPCLVQWETWKCKTKSPLQSSHILSTLPPENIPNAITLPHLPHLTTLGEGPITFQLTCSNSLLTDLLFLEPAKGIPTSRPYTSFSLCLECSFHIFTELNPFRFLFNVITSKRLLLTLYIKQPHLSCLPAFFVPLHSIYH